MKRNTRIPATVLIFVAATCSALSAQPAGSALPGENLSDPPIVSARAWAVADGKTGKIFWSANASQPREIASTTKLMTAWIVLEMAKQRPQTLREIVTVSARADKTGGSTAGVLAGEKLTVRDLLYGLLLPSGNDAAVALAEHFGNRLKRDSDKPQTAMQSFVAEMNRRAKQLGMKQTKYLDPHGNSRNRASVRDLVKLAHTAMQNSLLRGYVKTTRHVGMLTNPLGRKRRAVWTNTNQLLKRAEYHGIKTGTTRGAGACLVSAGVRNGDHLLVVVLGSTSRSGRYVDSRNLYRWAWRTRAAKK